jgi:hypothetical protein
MLPGLPSVWPRIGDEDPALGAYHARRHEPTIMPDDDYKWLSHEAPGATETEAALLDLRPPAIDL